MAIGITVFVEDRGDVDVGSVAIKTQSRFRQPVHKTTKPKACGGVAGTVGFGRRRAGSFHDQARRVVGVVVEAKPTRLGLPAA